MDSFMDDSIFDVSGDGSDFDAAPKPKAKAAPKPKKAAAAKDTTAAKAKKLTQTTLKPKAKAAGAPKKRKKADSEDEADDSLNDGRASLHDDSLLSTTPPSGKKVVTPAKKKSKGTEPLATLENGAMMADDKPVIPKNASEKYQMMSLLEHILKRPDTYIGSVERNERQMWVYNSEKNAMEFREISFVPGLYKIFDEILVNAADNKQNDKNMDTIKVKVDREKGEISVWNNGRGIPIEMHSEKQMYIPEMIFGHLLTSSNYNDDEAKITGGRNGFGAKLCNVFSTKFMLETVDGRQKKMYKQTWTNNMTKKGDHNITPAKNVDDYTKVTFYPDWEKFKMAGIDDDLDALIKRRVYDMAGTVKGVKVYLNGERLKLKGFKEYMEMYTKAIKDERGDEAKADTSSIVTDGDKTRWEIGFAVSDGAFQQVSFVNSISTTSGGSHVNYIADQIVNKLAETMKKRNRGGAALKPAQLRNHIFVFVNAQIVNPAFTSQTKEQLTTKPSQFGSKFTPSDEFFKKMLKTDVVDNILSFAQQKADQILKKSDGSKRSRMDNPKLTDANRAGTRDGYKCTLILTEGDSAKGLAMTGRSIIGPDLYGVFPLRGKLLNVRDASVDQVSKNAEIQNIKNILGLKHKQVYTDCKSLRYGHIMIMTDQDHDGSHIKGLLINFLQVQYPSLLKIPNFLIEFITPIAKVYKGDPKKPSKSFMFFTMPEYEAWKEQHKDERGWEHKYYKGLGTSTDDDAEMYFRDIDRHLKTFHEMQDKEPELLELVFSKKKADERKEWLRQFRPGTYLDHAIDDITYTNFINKELILFSVADNMRSIPSVIDGLKPGQRKVIFTCLKKNIRKDVKVVELAGQVMSATAYHHGDASLQQTIVGLAQTFVGSNNLNPLEPSGNFGSRWQGGSDHASARYIFTRLSPFARKVFHQLDEPLLKHNIDDEKMIEPEMYVPVVPMILINGADGIGTGWSSSIPNYNPHDIVDNLKRMMKGEEPEPMMPWFRDFEGTVEQTAPDRFEFSGVIKQVSDSEVEVTELPIRLWTQDFKDRLVEIIKSDKSAWIKDYDDYNTKQKVRFVVRMEDKHMKAAVAEGLLKRFKLTKTVATSNLVAFDAQGRITKYANVQEILRAFFDVRIKLYVKRKAYQLNEFGKELDKLTNQARFISEIIEGKLVVARKKKAVLVEELKAKNYTPYPKVVDATKDGELEPAMDDETGDKAVDTAANAYDYLLGMAIWSLTKERVDKLMKQISDKQAEIDDLIKLSKEDLWQRDLDDFIQEWDYQLQEEASRAKANRRAIVRGSAKLRTQIKGAGGRKRKNDSDDSDFEITKKSKKEKAPGGILAHLKPIEPVKPAPKPIVKAETAANIKKSTVPPTIDLSFDGVSDSDAFLDVAAESAAKKALDAVARNKIATIPLKQSDESDAGPVAPRGGRAAARKPVKYTLESDSDGGDVSDGDFDISRMVRGIGDKAAASTRPLFSASHSRPGSSAGLKAAASRTSLGRPSSSAADDVPFDADETDYALLAPRASAAVTAAKKKASATILSDSDEDVATKPTTGKTALGAVPDDEDDFDLPTKTATAAAVPAKKKGRPTGVKNKPKDAAASTKPAAATAVKPVTLSPMGKAYAKKLAQTKLSASSSSALAELKDDAFDMLSEADDNEDPFAVPTAAPATKKKAATSAAAKKSAAGTAAKAKPAAKPAAKKSASTAVLTEEKPTVSARPARRAAATVKKTWLEGSDESDGADDLDDSFGAGDDSD